MDELERIPCVKGLYLAIGRKASVAGASTVNPTFRSLRFVAVGVSFPVLIVDILKVNVG